MTELKRDKYRQARGGRSRLLELHCEKCGTLVCTYQKDGPGVLKRLYIDRIDKHIKQKNLVCKKCEELLGVFLFIKKKTVPHTAYLPGAVTKQTIPAK